MFVKMLPKSHWLLKKNAGLNGTAAQKERIDWVKLEDTGCKG
jgi:hypothetical protein